MNKEDVYFSLGSNLGDREANLRLAVEKMDSAFGVGKEKTSSFYYSKSWGFEGNDFVNCAVKYSLDLTPEEILDKCKEIEKEMGRDCKVEFDADGKRIYRDRIIDIDILLYGDKKINTERLTIPHPLMGKRDFVRIPLMEIFN